MLKSIDISWTFMDPPVRPSLWGGFESEPRSLPEDRATEVELGFPPGTLACLRLGFEKKLGRTTGWDDLRPGATAPSPVAFAAQSYKRGVANRIAGKTAATPSTSGTYAIEFLQGELPPRAKIDPGGLLVVDAKVARLWPDLPAHDQFLVLELDEHKKTLAAVAQILAGWRQRGEAKSWTVIGGGLLSDVAGYAAKLAGARAHLIPTTLLAMADAAVGGKTGVNFPPYGKNQVGAFYAPAAVHIWTGWLKTLPDRELLAGGAECLKHCFLSGDMQLAAKLVDVLIAKNLDGLSLLLPDIVQFKADVVREDPAETGRRAILNFGHTMGHAFEGLSQKNTVGEDTLLHGEAVALGMIFATVLSRRVGKLTGDQADRIIDLIRRLGGLPSRDVLQRRLGVADLKNPAFFGELTKLIGHDKKNMGNVVSTSSWILLDAPGKVARESHKEWTISLFETEIQHAMSEFLKVLHAV